MNDGTRMRRLRVLLGAVGAIGLLVLAAGPAGAHVDLEAATPAEGETITEELTEVVLEFSGPLQPGGDPAVGLFDPDGERVDTGETEEVSDRVVRTAVEPLQVAGEYTVQYLVVAGDGHTMEDSYTFTYDGPLAEAAAPEPEPAPAETDATDPAPEETPTPEPSPEQETPAEETGTDDAQETAAVEEGGGGAPLALIVGIVALVAVGAGFLLARTRSGAAGADPDGGPGTGGPGTGGPGTGGPGTGGPGSQR